MSKLQMIDGLTRVYKTRQDKGYKKHHATCSLRHTQIPTWQIHTTTLL